MKKAVAKKAPKTEKVKSVAKPVVKKVVVKAVAAKEVFTGNSYELTVVVSGKVKAEQRKDVVEVVKKLIEAQKGTIAKMEEWGLKDLAYQIRHEMAGWYVFFVVSLPAESVKMVEQELLRNAQVLRHLMIRL